jgi:hypothetical protein
MWIRQLLSNYFQPTISDDGKYKGYNRSIYAISDIKLENVQLIIGNNVVECLPDDYLCVSAHVIHQTPFFIRANGTGKISFIEHAEAIGCSFITCISSVNMQLGGHNWVCYNGTLKSGDPIHVSTANPLQYFALNPSSGIDLETRRLYGSSTDDLRLRARRQWKLVYFIYALDCPYPVLHALSRAYLFQI